MNTNIFALLNIFFGSAIIVFVWTLMWYIIVHSFGVDKNFATQLSCIFGFFNMLAYVIYIIENWIKRR